MLRCSAPLPVGGVAVIKRRRRLRALLDRDRHPSQRRGRHAHRARLWSARTGGGERAIPHRDVGNGRRRQRARRQSGFELRAPGDTTSQCARCAGSSDGRGEWTWRAPQRGWPQFRPLRGVSRQASCPTEAPSSTIPYNANPDRCARHRRSCACERAALVGVRRHGGSRRLKASRSTAKSVPTRAPPESIDCRRPASSRNTRRQRIWHQRRTLRRCRDAHRGAASHPGADGAGQRLALHAHGARRCRAHRARPPRRTDAARIGQLDRDRCTHLQRVRLHHPALGLATMTALVISFAVGPRMIRKLAEYKIGTGGARRRTADASDQGKGRRPWVAH